MGRGAYVGAFGYELLELVLPLLFACTREMLRNQGRVALRARKSVLVCVEEKHCLVRPPSPTPFTHQRDRQWPERRLLRVPRRQCCSCRGCPGQDPHPRPLLTATCGSSAGGAVVLRSWALERPPLPPAAAVVQPCYAYPAKQRSHSGRGGKRWGRRVRQGACCVEERGVGKI